MDRLLNADLQIELGNTSALDDGFETLGFEIAASDVRGLIVGVRAYLDSIKLVRALGSTGSDNEGRKFLLLQRLGERQCVSLASDGRNLKHDSSLGNQWRIDGRIRLRQL